MKSNQLSIKTKPSEFKVRPLLLAVITILLAGPQPAAQEVSPALEFPQEGLDDTATYRGYTTRFFRDSEGNTIQIAVDQNAGRIRNIWADAANESIAFTARDTSGQPAQLEWDSPGAEVFSKGPKRYVQYTLLAPAPALHMGHFILGSMRLERDFHYQQRHTLPFDSEPFIVPELTELINNLEKLPARVRTRHLAMLEAKNLPELRSRLLPHLKHRSKSQVLIEHSTFDGKNTLSLEVQVDSNQAAIDLSQDKISIHSLRGQPIQLTIIVGTDSPALTPLGSEDIFNPDFREFYEHARAEHDSLLAAAGPAQPGGLDKGRRLRFKRLERQLKSVELLSSQEKLMAGLPNFATYFGRDMMMSALMLEPVWTPAMLEHVIAGVLRKLAPSGEVSHEEGLGGQAIRENAAEYNRLMAEYFQGRGKQTAAEASGTHTRAVSLLTDLNKVTENYRMVDDDFQLPVLAARYLTRSDVPADRKRAFLLAPVGKGNQAARLTLLLRNLHYVAQRSHPYVENPQATNLVAFPRLAEQRWFPGSWRDSGAGYANGRFAMDINVVWVPQALESVAKIFTILPEIGISIDDLLTFAPEIRETRLSDYANRPERLQQALITWRTASQHFEVHLSAPEVQRRVRAKLDWLPAAERTYWDRVLAESGAAGESISFLALALDAQGRPLAVANTDLATWLFLERLTERIISGEADPEAIIERLKVLVRPYPVGLFLEGVGPVVANDAYADQQVWENFHSDVYHSPRVVWGREVNLLLLGLARQIRAAFDSSGQIKDPHLDFYVRELRSTLDKLHTAVGSSGLKHNELWSYRIVDHNLISARYPTTSDIQLWNLTDLAVQFLLEGIADPH